MGRTDYYILNDPELCFQEVLRKKVSTETAPDSKGAIKLESHEDILKFDKNEILVKLEKGEGTLKIEKVALKKEGTEEKEKKKPEKAEEAVVTVVKNEKEEEAPVKTEEAVAPAETTETEEIEKKVEDSEKVEEPVSEPEKEIKEEESETKSEVKEETEVKTKPEETEKEKPKSAPVDEAADLCSKQAAELKAMFPDLEVIQPLSRLSQIDTFVLREQKSGGALDFSETTVAQLFNNAVKWPKEYAIQVRLQHIIYAIETKEWPASKSFSAYANGIGNEFDIPIHELPNDPPRRESGTPIGDSELITITTDSMNRANSMKKRRRHIAIDVETERAKLQALLNNTPVLSNPLMKHNMSWENDDSEDSRRSTPVTTATLQPPPAHQQTTRLLNMPYDLKYHSSPKTIGQTTVIPGTSSTLTPIDLSSG